MKSRRSSRKEERPPPAEKEEFPSRSPDFWYDLTKDQLAQQMADVNALDSKLGLFLSAGSAVIGFQLAVYAFQPSRFGFWQVRSLILAAAIYGLLSTVALVGLLSRSWGEGPDVRQLEADAEEKKYDDDQLKWKAASRYLEDFETNQQKYNLKVWGLRVAASCLIAETISVGFGLFALAAAR
jgi:hypothetical protein